MNKINRSLPHHAHKPYVAFPALSPGRQIRLTRVQRQITQAELAGELGISPVQLSRIERGDISIPQAISETLSTWLNPPNLKTPTSKDRCEGLSVHQLVVPSPF